MLHEIGKELEVALLAKGCPFKVKDREDFKPNAHRNVIVIEHDGGDSIAQPRSQSENPKRWYTRTVGAKLTIYASSAKSGANEFEHRRLAEHVLDLTLVALRFVCNERDFLPAFGRGQFVDIDDLAKSEVPAGAVYELAFSIARGVAETEWDGSIADTVTVATETVQTTTYVSQAQGPDDDADESTPPATAEIV